LDCSTTTTVAAGTLGTCDDVANATGISVETLFHNNPNINSTCGNIYGGEVGPRDLSDYNTRIECYALIGSLYFGGAIRL